MRHCARGFGSFLLLAVSGLLAGCSTVPFRAPLHVGITPDFPPIIAKADGVISGLEADFAVRLARDLHRSLEFVELPWEQEVPALLSGKIDLIMSGMSVSDTRRVRVDFCDPYMQSGLMALVRREDVRQYASADDVKKCDGRIGAKKGTMANVFVEEHCRRARLVLYTIPNDAAVAVKNKKLDMFIHDAPSIWWLASKYEADVAVVPVRLTEEELAWAIRPGNAALKEQVNRILADWKATGALHRMLTRHVPYM